MKRKRVMTEMTGSESRNAVSNFTKGVMLGIALYTAGKKYGDKDRKKRLRYLK